MYQRSEPGLSLDNLLFVSFIFPTSATLVSRWGSIHQVLIFCLVGLIAVHRHRLLFGAVRHVRRSYCVSGCSLLVPFPHLLKEDLHFELLARGLTPGSDCESMRKQLRDNMDLDTTWPRDLTFQKQRPILEAKLETFENSQEDWLESPPTGRERARYLSRLTHLHMRLSLLRAKLTSSGDKEWLEERITLVDGLLTVLERDEGAKAPEKTVSAVNSAAAVKGEGQIPGSVVAEVSGVDGTRGPVTQMPAGSGGLGTVVTGSFVQYHKLPNQLTPLLQRLPTVDGLDTEALLRFLSEILRLHDLPDLQGTSFLHVISP
ncbi:hypothetical protein J6590_094737, partial [Homalodisca vitripennis]